MLVRGRGIGIGAGHIDILGDWGVRGDSPQRARSAQRQTCLVFCLCGLCGLCGDPVWLRLRRAALRVVPRASCPCRGMAATAMARPLRLQVAQEALE